MPRPRSAAFLMLAWAASVQSCGWESTLSAAGSLTPDTLITVRSELEQKTILIRGKAADFGACPPLAEDAIYAPIRKAQYAEQYDDMEYGRHTTCREMPFEDVRVRSLRMVVWQCGTETVGYGAQVPEISTLWMLV